MKTKPINRLAHGSEQRREAQEKHTKTLRKNFEREILGKLREKKTTRNTLLLIES